MKFRASRLFVLPLLALGAMPALAWERMEMLPRQESATIPADARGLYEAGARAADRIDREGALDRFAAAAALAPDHAALQMLTLEYGLALGKDRLRDQARGAFVVALDAAARLLAIEGLDPAVRARAEELRDEAAELLDTIDEREADRIREGYETFISNQREQLLLRRGITPETNRDYDTLVGNVPLLPPDEIERMARGDLPLADIWPARVAAGSGPTAFARALNELRMEQMREQMAAQQAQQQMGGGGFGGGFGGPMGGGAFPGAMPGEPGAGGAFGGFGGPMGGGAPANPFGAGGGNPFGGGGAAPNPFGGGGAAANPFGGDR